MDSITSFFWALPIWAIPVLLAITFHEAAHGYVAHWLGDDTAKRAGRLSFNPIAHVDLFGTVILPLLLLYLGGFIFGYAKPVPVNPNNLRKPRRDMVLVAAAGPGANILLAIAGALLMPLALVLPEFLGSWLGKNIANLILLNCLLAVLNMLPLPPLDGSKVAYGLLPPHLARRYGRIAPYGIFILVGIVFILPMLGRPLGLDLDIGRYLIFEPSYALANWILTTFGIGV